MGSNNQMKPLKLGEALIESSVITRDQLKQALERQVIFGGRIGTNIIEMGILTEREMISFLETFYRVKAVKASDLDDIDAEVIACINSTLAEKYKVLPFRKDKNRLHVAMLDPKEFANVDEIRFLTGYDIIPYVITELRLLFCLDKYYGIKRDLRYISVSGKEEGYEEKNPEDRKEEILRVKEQFASARTKEEVIGILLNETKSAASRAAVLLVKGNKVSGWRSRGIPLDGLEMPAGGQSIVADVLSSRNLYRGPLLRMPGNEPLIDRLNGVPKDCCIIPILIREKIIGLLYVDNGNTAVLDAGLSFVNSLVAMVAVSFEILILRNKLFAL